MGVLVSDEVREERLKQCFECDRAVKPAGMNLDDKTKGIVDWWFGMRCQVCKCGLRPKTMLELSKCPLGKWKR